MGHRNLETHHHHKVDAPSGTALALGKAAARGRGVALDGVADMVRKAKPVHKQGDIGFAVTCGDVVGEHSVIFYGESERGNFTSRNRPELFSHAGLFVQHDLLSANSGFYDMTDVLKG